MLLLASSGLLFGACVQPQIFKGDDYAFLRSNYPVLEVNGESIEPTYQLDIKAGETTVVIVYNTYRHDYYCTFNWNAQSNTVYEVTDQENQYPLTLYRWAPTNSLWASRLDPLNPLECSKEPRRGKATDE
jgi:hypothetical protein